MWDQYFSILLFVLVGCIIGVVPIAVGRLFNWLGLRPNIPDAQKLKPYECGFEAFEDARIPFDVRFYLVSVLFIIFDLEVAFLFPWAVVFGDLSDWAFWGMMIFLGLLTIGFIYEWRKGALEWE